jgi:hypothetical protein
MRRKYIGLYYVQDTLMSIVEIIYSIIWEITPGHNIMGYLGTYSRVCREITPGDTILEYVRDNTRR